MLYTHDTSNQSNPVEHRVKLQYHYETKDSTPYRNSRHGKAPRWMLIGLATLAIAIATGGRPGDVQTVHAAVVVRIELEPGVRAAIKSGRVLMLECTLPKGDAAKLFLVRYLAEPDSWSQYKNRLTVAIPFKRLNAKTQRTILRTVFPDDYVDDTGWWHTVAFQGERGVETWWTLSEWFTGSGANYNDVQANEHNRRFDTTLAQGQRLLFPKNMLRDAFRPPTKALAPVITPPPNLPNGGELAYGSDANGQFARYKLKPKETIYGSVVIQFTDYRDNSDIQAASNLIVKRSAIKNARKIRAGQEVKIPIEMLADRYRPLGSERRIAYEAVQQETRRLAKRRVPKAGLEGVVIILDPGHGGRDHGAYPPRSGLYEDELTYDIACRIKRLLEQKTAAEVYMTLKDSSQGFAVSNKTSFPHDKDEILLTTPTYNNAAAKTSVNLRAYLANDIYRKSLRKGILEEDILFASIHCDALYDKRLRGAMIYVPGAQYRNSSELPRGNVYNSFAEAKNNRTIRTTPALSRRDEALSRVFANTLLYGLENNTPEIKVHSMGTPIRNVIRRGGGQEWLPAVLRNTIVPTKVLVETANLTNPTDRQRVADPKWRQWFSEAFVDSVIKHFGANEQARLAATNEKNNPASNKS